MLKFLGSSPPPRTDVLSAGFAGVSSSEARDAWAEESRRGPTSPGAYEWWYFHAVSPAGDGFMLALFDGLPFHPNYLTQISRYSRRLPSLFKKPWPSLQPSRYPAAYMSVYQGGKRIAQFLNLYPPHTTFSEPGMPDIRVGPNRITLRQDGSFGIVVKGYPYTTARGRPRRQPGQLLSGQFTFTPSFAGVQHTRPFRAPDRTGAAHHWILTAPHGHMTGQIQITDDASDEPPVQLDVDTLGYHDHVYGEGGLGTDIDTLLWGFIQGDHWTAAWHQCRTHSRQEKPIDGLIFFEEGHPPIVINEPETRFSKSHLSPWLVKHPGRITTHGSDAHGHPVELLLNHARGGGGHDAAPFHTRLAAQGSITIPGRGNNMPYTGHGATHVLKLHRLRWPILSDLTLLAMTSISRDDPIWNA